MVGSSALTANLPSKSSCILSVTRAVSPGNRLTVSVAGLTGPPGSRLAHHVALAVLGLQQELDRRGAGAQLAQAHGHVDHGQAGGDAFGAVLVAEGDRRRPPELPARPGSGAGDHRHDGLLQRRAAVQIDHARAVGDHGARAGRLVEVAADAQVWPRSARRCRGSPARRPAAAARGR